MSKYEITIKENGIEIKTQEVETLFNANGEPVEVPKGNHRTAVGLGDFCKDPIVPTADELHNYRSKIHGVVSKNIGESLTSLLNDAKVSYDRKNIFDGAYADAVTSQKSVVDMLGEEITKSDNLVNELGEVTFSLHAAQQAIAIQTDDYANLLDKYNALANSIPANDK